MEHHRNPSPPDSPKSHSSASADAQSHDQSVSQVQEPSSLVSYDDCISDTVFSKAWVLSLLVKAVDTVREQERKIEMLSHAEDGVDGLEMCREERERASLTRTEQSLSGDPHGMSMESLEYVQADWNNLERERPTCGTMPVTEQGRSSPDGASRGATSPAEQRDCHISRSNGDISSVQRTGKESMSSEHGGDLENALSDQQEEGRRRGWGNDNDYEAGFGESLSAELEVISESLENDLCRLWDASMNTVCLHVHINVCLIATQC